MKIHQKFFKKKKNSELKLGEIIGVPANVSFLADSPNHKTINTNLEVILDKKLDLVRAKNPVTVEYYEQYFMTTSYSDSIQLLQENQVKRLSKLQKELNTGKQENGKRSLVEIGSGDGSFLLHARKYFDKVVGIEPSEKFASVSRNSGLEIYQEYVSEDQEIIKEKFDAFVSRQVFEHLHDPIDCLMGIKKLCKNGSVGLIEVPNGSAALRKGNFYEFFPDHVNYFSPTSLIKLADACGFSVISCENSFGGDYLELWVVLEESIQRQFENLVKNIDTIKKSISSFAFDKNLDEPKAIFGAGAKTLSLAAQDIKLFQENFDCIIDSDPNKAGKYLPNTRIPVISPELIDAREIRSVLILSLSYKKEVSELLKKFPAILNVYSLDSKNKLVSLW